MIELLPSVIAEVERGGAVALTLVVRTRGSCPQKRGAAMVVFQDGKTLGTLGGGCVEAETRVRALRMLASTEPAPPPISSYSLNSDLGWDDGLICGGNMTIAIQILRAEPDLQPLRQLTADLAARKTGIYPLAADGETYQIEYEPTPRLVIAGAGHVAQALARLAAPAGFEVTVLDDREEYLSPDRFPTATRQTGPIPETLSRLQLDPHTYIVIATRGHRNDGAALAAVISRQAKYKGLLGSKRKVLTLLADLATSGVSPDDLKSVRGPIGLAIGAISPEEIAVSIMAELIAVRRGGAGAELPRLGITPEMLDRALTAAPPSPPGSP